jgi:hypothetical protein
MEFLGLKKREEASTLRRAMLSRKTSEYFSTLNGNGKKNGQEESF